MIRNGRAPEGAGAQTGDRRRNLSTRNSSRRWTVVARFSDGKYLYKQAGEVKAWQVFDQLDRDHRRGGRQLAFLEMSSPRVRVLWNDPTEVRRQRETPTTEREAS